MTQITRAQWADFDEAFYRQRTSLTATPPQLGSLLQHYLTEGAKQGYSPNIWFDETFYRRASPELEQLIQTGELHSAFVHYCTSGYQSHAPHWLFDPKTYEELNPQLTSRVLTDSGFVNSYDHFLRHGAVEQRQGHRFFDPACYLAALPPDEVANCVAMGPFKHFLCQSWPCNEPGDLEPKTSSHFDPAWYREAYPAVAGEVRAGRWHSALHHYLFHKEDGTFKPLPSIKLHIDRPQHILGEAVAPIAGAMDIVGWAAADRPVNAIELYLNGIHIGRAHHGIRTEGVAAAFPEFLHAMFAGFRFIGPPPQMAGRHILRIMARDASGLEVATEIAVQSELDATSEGPWSLRRRMPLSEVDLKRRLLDASDIRPKFGIVLACPSDGEISDGLQKTITSLNRQFYSDWHLLSSIELNMILESTTTDFWYVRLIQGDELGVDALLELAIHRLTYPDVDFVYSDERSPDGSSEESSAMVTAEYSPDFLCDADYCGRLWAAKAAVLHRAGLTPKDLTDICNHEIVVRLTKHAKHIRHLRLVLCDRAAHPNQESKAAPLLTPLAGKQSHFRSASTAEVIRHQDPEFIEILYPARPLAAAHSVRRILILKLDHLGDFILSLPAIRHLRQAFRSARITLLVAPSLSQLAILEPAIDECLTFEFFHPRSELGCRTPDEAELAKLEFRLRAETFDLAIDLRCHSETRQLLQRTGATWLAGFDGTHEFPWLDIVGVMEPDIERGPKRTHAADTLEDFAKKIASAFVLTQPETLRPAEPKARSLLPAHRPICRIAIHPGAGNVNKLWPISHYAALIDQLIEALDCMIILVGSQDDKAGCAPLLTAERLARGVLSAVGETDLTELAHMIAGCDLFIGNDSGPHHLAAALHIPTIGIHGGVVDAREWSPLGPSAIAIRRRVVCSPCYLAKAADCPRDQICLTGISPESVLELALRQLSRYRRNSPANEGGRKVH